MEVNFPAFAHLVTVFGSTRNSDATSAGVNNRSWAAIRERFAWLIYFFPLHFYYLRADIERDLPVRFNPYGVSIPFIEIKDKYLPELGGAL
jgi:hypothetical protein